MARPKKTNKVITPNAEPQKYAKYDDPLRQKEVESFLEALSEWPNITNASKVSGLTRHVVRWYRENNPDFTKRFDEAWKHGIDALEAHAFNMAKENPTMMIFMLKGNKPDKYGDKKDINLSGDLTVSLNMTLHGQKS